MALSAGKPASDKVVIGTADMHVSLAPQARGHAARDVAVAIAAGPLGGSFNAELDIRGFRNALERVYATLAGQARLAAAGDTLEIEVRGNHSGRFGVTALARPDRHAELKLAVVIDHSAVPGILSAIDRVFLSPANEPD